MSGWKGVKKRKHVNPIFRHLVGLTLKEAQESLDRLAVVVGGWRIKTVCPIGEFRFMDSDVHRLRVYVDKRDRITSIGDVG